MCNRKPETKTLRPGVVQRRRTQSRQESETLSFSGFQQTRNRLENLKCSFIVGIFRHLRIVCVVVTGQRLSEFAAVWIRNGRILGQVRAVAAAAAAQSGELREPKVAAAGSSRGRKFTAQRRFVEGTG